MLNKELESKIIRLYRVEKWPIGTIVKQLGVHHTAVKRVLEKAGMPVELKRIHPSILDPYLPFIIETLKKYPDLRASRLHQMIKERGYQGRLDYFRHKIAQYRPRPATEAYLRLRTLPGEQAQVDWAHFGTLPCGRAERKLVAFVMVLSWSRQIFLRFFLGQHMENFLRGHVEAFDYFGGVPRVLLYDNLKSAVLERNGSAIRFNPTLLECASHYHFEPRPVAVARGNEKGRVERSISYARNSFFAAREIVNLKQLNHEAMEWSNTIASDRLCPEDRSISVRQAFSDEKNKLLPLPADAFPTEERVVARIGKTPYARFDGNDYSLPHTLVRQDVVILANEEHVRILTGNDVVATHPRSYGRLEQIEDTSHIEALVEVKANARQHRGMDYLRNAVPTSYLLLKTMASHGSNIGGATQILMSLVDLYGAAEVESALKETLEQNSPHPHSVRLILERRWHERNTPPPIAVTLPDNPSVRRVVIKPHELSTYDSLDLPSAISTRTEKNDDA